VLRKSLIKEKYCSLLIFVLEWVIEINYTSKAKQGNACKAEWNTEMIQWILK
jgi:hypothetical protein